MFKHIFYSGLICIFLIQSSCNPTVSYRYWATKKIAPKDYKVSENFKLKTGHFAKLHTKNGQVYVLNKWSFSKSDKSKEIIGFGVLYDRDRQPIKHGNFIINVDQLTLIETTHPRQFKRTSKLLIGLGVGVAVVGLFCIVATKACFGSCPTIYNGELKADELESSELLAEGFSDAIAPSLESRDLDPLVSTRWSAEHKNVTLTLTNEAYETHAIKQMNVWAVDLPDQRFVDMVHTPMPDEAHLYPITQSFAPLKCQSSATGNCLAQVKKADYQAHLAPAHSKDLGHREHVILSLPNPYEQWNAQFADQHSRKDPTVNKDLRPAVVISLRNSLLNTYIFYQLWSWLGLRAGDWLMHLESLMQAGVDNKSTVGKSTFKRISAALGDLHVELLNGVNKSGEEQWLSVGRYDEIGPLAQEKVIFLLPKSLPQGPLTLRLTNAQGNFRLDYIASTLAGNEQKGRLLHPSVVRNQQGQTRDQLLELLKEPKEYLVTYPGDLFYIDYSDPKGTEQSRYFLDSTGHYVEWQQPSWLKEQNEAAFIDFLIDPSAGLKKLAPRYKKLEPNIEKEFWNSRFRMTGTSNE